MKGVDGLSQKESGSGVPVVRCCYNLATVIDVEGITAVFDPGQ
jgi:hypothetical protein